MQSQDERKGFLIFGGSGWLGGLLTAMLKEQGEVVNLATARLEDRAAIQRDLLQYKPKYVLNVAGMTGRPNVDWCEDNKQQTTRVNVVGTVNLVDTCYLEGVHVTNYASGCIYEYDEQHTIGGQGFKEEDVPNYVGSFYSHTKVMAEKLLEVYPNVLTLRLRMPISDDLSPRNFVTKISKYERVVNVPNSVSILHDLLPISIDMTKKERKGVYNFTNPGAASHNEVLALYKKYIKPDFEWKNFSIEEQAKILKAGRSNNTLDVSKLVAEYPDLPEVHTALDQMFQRMQKNLGLN
jgi:dTDP-4-dehydrorhamnose reductase